MVVLLRLVCDTNWCSKGLQNVLNRDRRSMMKRFAWSTSLMRLGKVFGGNRRGEGGMKIIFFLLEDSCHTDGGRMEAGKEQTQKKRVVIWCWQALDRDNAEVETARRLSNTYKVL